MKFIVKIVLLMFLTFLSTPTIVGFLFADVDTSIIYSTCDDENQKETKAEVKCLLSEIVFQLIQKKRSVIFSNYPHKHDNILKDIQSPPPDRI